MPLVVAVLVALCLPITVLVPASLIVSVGTNKLRKSSDVLLGMLMQVLILGFTLIVALLISRGLGILGSLSLPPVELLEGVALALLIALVAYDLGGMSTSKCEPPLKLRSIWEYVLLAFIAAPLGEELLFRGQ